MVRVSDGGPQPPEKPGRPPRVAFVGAGQMGDPMVRRMLAARIDVRLHARRPEVRETFAALGAHTTASLTEAVADAELVISCLFNEKQVEDVLLAPDGLLAVAAPGAVVVSHTTVGLRTVARVEEAATARGLAFVDGPVSGAPEDILAGRLTILAGGDAAAIDRAEPVLGSYGTVLRTGGVGTASKVKLVNNLLFTVNVQTVAAAADLGRQLGVEPQALFAGILRCSGASSAMQFMHAVGSIEEFARRGARYLRKDVFAALGAAEEAGAEAELLAHVARSGPLPLTTEAEHTA